MNAIIRVYDKFRLSSVAFVLHCVEIKLRGELLSLITHFFHSRRSIEASCEYECRISFRTDVCHPDVFGRRARRLHVRTFFPMTCTLGCTYYSLALVFRI